jgi:hypothetical protein
VSFKLEWSNPTDYSGLSVVQISCRLSYLAGLHEVPVVSGGRGGLIQYVSTYWWDLPARLFHVNIPVPPHISDNVSLVLVVNILEGSISDMQNAQSFVSFLRTAPSDITWSLSFQFLLSTFLTSVQVPRSFSNYVTHMSY